MVDWQARRVVGLGAGGAACSDHNRSRGRSSVESRSLVDKSGGRVLYWDRNGVHVPGGPNVGSDHHDLA